MLNYLLPKKIYEYLSETISDLPPFFYNASSIENEGFVFQTLQPEGISQTNFCKDIKIYKWKLFYIKNSFGNAHIKQIENMNNILKKLNDLKTFDFQDNEIIVKCVYINDQPFPNESWVVADVENYDVANQIYSITLGLELLERKK